jgi:hypothetical protein
MYVVKKRGEDKSRKKPKGDISSAISNQARLRPLSNGLHTLRGHLLKSVMFRGKHSHSFLQKSVIAYVEQVALAVAVRATETNNRLSSCADNFGDFAFFSFIRFFKENFGDFCGVVVKQVIYVPKLSFLISKVTFYSLFQISLRGTDVSV